MFPHELSVHVSFEPPSLKQHMTLRNMQSRNTTVLSKFFVKLVLVGKARTGCRCHFSALRVCLLRVDIRAVFQRASVSPSPNCGVWRIKLECGCGFECRRGSPTCRADCLPNLSPNAPFSCGMLVFRCVKRRCLISPAEGAAELCTCNVLTF